MSTELLTVAPEDTLGEVAERMLETDIRSALVTEYGRLIGILTSRDMLHALAGRVHPSEARARQWMTAEPITATASTPRDTAAILMAEHHIGQLPVVDGERAVGILRARDLVPTDTSCDGRTCQSGSACDLTSSDSRSEDERRAVDFSARQRERGRLWRVFYSVPFVAFLCDHTGPLPQDRGASGRMSKTPPS